jgi:RNA polymerase sigma factor (sigma-70 family)
MRQLNADEARNSVDIALYDRYASTMLAYLYRQVASQQDAEDLLLEVFIAALSSDTFSSFTDEQQLAWLRRVARNKVIDRYRHTAILTMQPLEEVLEMEDGEPTPEQHALKLEQYEHLYQSLEQLSPLQQELIRLRYGNGLRIVEIASIFDRPEGTMRKLLARTLRQLRTLYERQERGKSK